MGELVADTSVLIDFFSGRGFREIAQAIADEMLILPPLVLGELVTGAVTREQRVAIGEFLQDVPLHPTPLAHWIAVGDLRQRLRRHGLTITISDAHIAQCAIDRSALLLTRDAIFVAVAKHAPLRVAT